MNLSTTVSALVLLAFVAPAYADRLAVDQSIQDSKLARVVGSLLQSYDGRKMRGGAQDVTAAVCQYVDPNEIQEFMMPGNYSTSHSVDPMFGNSMSVNIDYCGWFCLTGAEIWINVDRKRGTCHAQINPMGFGAL
jgi:hypothetical protein